ncbi:MAG: nucleotide exchange factor GrpE [Acidobacteria bacterium]|nr:MAG: nucleotide exchange factor GrpE [Acidobacteriota bacterium]
MAEKRDVERIPVKDKRRFTPEGELRPDAEIEREQEAVEEAAGPEPAAAALEAAEARARAAEERLAQFQEAFQRYREEQERIRERLERDRQARVDEAIGRVFARILEALDNLDRALEFAEEGPLKKGVLLVRQQILDAMRQEGLERIDVEGRPFDPRVAEAVGVEPVGEEERHDVVTEELRAGYRFKDQVLRPAQVRVGRRQEEG